MTEESEDPTQPLKDASEEVRQIVIEVLKLEKERLMEVRPRVNADIEDIIKRAIPANEN